MSSDRFPAGAVAPDQTDESDSAPGRGREIDGAAPVAGDAVSDVKRWLAQRGIAVPDDAGQTGPTPPDPHLRRSGRQVDGLVVDDHEPAVATARNRWKGQDRSHSGADDGPDADPESVARAIVTRKLAVQARTRFELQKALDAKEVPEAAATAVLDRMESLGLIDDPAFARDWIESRQRRRYLSKAALRRELAAKGIDRTEVETALEVVDGDDELAAAQALVDKKLRSMSELSPLVRQRRLAGVLGRRGFNSSIISRVLAETARAADS